MKCPLCKKDLDKAILSGVEVDYCPNCLGIFFEEEELRWAKDTKDRNLSWFDIDLWKEKKKFKIARGPKLCPACRLPLYEVEYSDSKIYPVKSRKAGISPKAKLFNGVHPVKSRKAGISPKAKLFNGVKVDVCNLCKGIWLDRGEFEKIIKYLKKRADYEILENYTKNLLEEFWEIFSGPETLREEILDFLAILKILNYKFTAQHPIISKIIASLPK